MLAEIPSRAAARAKLLLSTTFAKTRMLSNRSTEPSDHCATSNSLFDAQDIIKGWCRVHSTAAEETLEGVCKSLVLGALRKPDGVQRLEFASHFDPERWPEQKHRPSPTINITTATRQISADIEP
jgi:hypothetical protein